MLREFQEFAIKGNVVDMAVGIIIGAAFTGVVQSLVDDVLMPPLGLVTGGLDFAEMFLVLKPGVPDAHYATLAEARAGGATVLAYGSFLNALVGLLLVASALFFIVRWINRLRRPDTPPAPRSRACPFCKSHVDQSATRCAHCTSELPPVEAATT